MFLFLCLLSTLIAYSSALPPRKVRYDGHKVVEILHEKEEDLRKIIDIGHLFKADFWNLPRHSNDSLHLRIRPEKFQDFASEIKKIGASFKVFIDDVQSLIDQEPEVTSHHRQRRATWRSSGYDVERSYHGYNSINAYLDRVASAVLPGGVNATKINIGHTYEGRQVNLLHITAPSSLTSKKAIFIDGGIHAREWISPAAVMYFIEQLAYNPNLDPVITTMLHHFDFYLLPVLNPDGFEYSRNIERLWRKNRNVATGSSCVGVDLNRNFPFHWDPSIGGSINPCSDLYSGPSSASELETKNLVNFLRTSRSNPIVAYLTIHSYGQMWLYPWGYTSALPADYTDLRSVARKATHNLSSLYHTHYTVGSSTRVLYSAAGGSDDFAKGDAGVKYSYTVELRDTGSYGFVLPISLIEPTVKETFAGLKAFTTSMAAHEGW